MLCFIIPYAQVEILTLTKLTPNETLKDFDMSCFDNVYTQGAPEVYDCKVFSYHKEEYAKVLYVFGDCEIAVMAELEWNTDNDCWDLTASTTMWSTNGGNA